MLPDKVSKGSLKPNNRACSMPFLLLIVSQISNAILPPHLAGKTRGNLWKINFSCKRSRTPQHNRCTQPANSVSTITSTYQHFIKVNQLLLLWAITGMITEVIRSCYLVVMTQRDAAFLIKAYSFVNNVTKLYYCANNLKYYIHYRIRLLRDPLFASDVKGSLNK